MEKTPSKENIPQSLGGYLKALRAASGFSLRDVEEGTEISNAYLSQLENEKITKPSPHILHKLAAFYGVAYELLMEQAGYIKREAAGKGTGRLAASSLGKITPDEEKELLQFLGFIRSQKKGKKE
jgi:transcriptional regulator with XRE-family HTH domain